MFNFILSFIYIFFFLDETYDVTNEEKLSTGQISLFILDAGGFQGKRTSEYIIPIIDPPSRNPDATITQQTSVDQVRKIM